jgi:predicted O-methyltransferase YrrM
VAAVDAWLAARLPAPPAEVVAALEASRAAGLPPHEVSVAEGRFLAVLARAVGARRVLEIGTLGGVSALWLASGGASVVTIEADPGRAAVARSTLVGSDAVVLEGRALEVLPGVEGPFDLVFVDADKESSVEYLEWALRLARPGSLLVFDNVIRGGAVADESSDDPRVRGVRALIERLGSDARLTVAALQTVGEKGHDGFAIAVVTAP